MPQSDPQSQPSEAELSPDAAAVIARARRSFGVSMMVLLLGFIAIGGALVYRAMRDDSPATDRYALESVTLPSGASVISTSAGDGLVTITYRLDDETQVRILDGTTGETVGQFSVKKD